METVIVLHNIRSAHNVGSIFRTADAAGVNKIFLTGYTPTPSDRFGRAQKDIAKAALGAEKYIAWEHVKNPYKAIDRLREGGWKIVGVEQDERAVDYRKVKKCNKTALIFGNEVRGLSEKLRTACDLLTEIPMHGKKESLNVSVAVGIVLFTHTKNT